MAVALPEGLNPVAPVPKELGTGVEELRSGNGVEEDVVLYSFEELRLPPTASADVVVVTLSFKLDKTLESDVVPIGVGEKGGAVITGTLEFVAWTLLYDEELDGVGAEIPARDES